MYVTHSHIQVNRRCIKTPPPYKCAWVYVCGCVCTYTYTHTHANTNTNTHTHTHVHTRAYTHTHSPFTETPLAAPNNEGRG